MARLLRNINPRGFNVGPRRHLFLYCCPSASHGRKVSPSSSVGEQRDRGEPKREGSRTHTRHKRKSHPFMMGTTAFVMKISSCIEMTVSAIPPFMFMSSGYLSQLLVWWHWFIVSANEPGKQPCSGVLSSLLWARLCFLEKKKKKQLWWSTWREPAEARSLPRSQLVPPASRGLVYITGSADWLNMWLAGSLPRWLVGSGRWPTGWMTDWLFVLGLNGWQAVLKGKTSCGVQPEVGGLLGVMRIIITNHSGPAVGREQLLRLNVQAKSLFL